MKSCIGTKSSSQHLLFDTKVLLYADTFPQCLFSVQNGQATPRVIFQNADCQRRFGLPRPVSACCDVVAAMSDDQSHALQDWELGVIEVMPVLATLQGKRRVADQSGLQAVQTFRPCFC